ncbi:MAG: hypothetical protein ACXW1C_02405 [Gallionella sp.]
MNIKLKSAKNGKLGVKRHAVDGQKIGVPKQVSEKINRTLHATYARSAAPLTTSHPSSIYEKNCHSHLWSRQQYAGFAKRKFALHDCGGD